MLGSTSLRPVVAERIKGALHARDASLVIALDRAHDAPHPGLTVELLRRCLASARRACGEMDDWRAVVEGSVRTHQSLSLALEDPLVARCYAKPRGYSGDAVALDFLYEHDAIRPTIAQSTPRGQALRKASTYVSAALAVRNRCRLLADEIDVLCASKPSAEILSIACGHFREAEQSAAIQKHRFGRVVALDQDPESLTVVRHDYGGLGVEAIEGSAKTVIARGRQLGQFDFVYAAGLYDYLNDKVATRLLRAMWELVKPGGRLWIANFLPDIVDAGFMEALMDWWLIYRTPEQMIELGAALDGQQVAEMRTFKEAENNIVFLEVRRNG